jgi:hypothetical protein
VALLRQARQVGTMSDLEEFWTDIRPQRLSSGPTVASKVVFKQALRDCTKARRDGRLEEVKRLYEVINTFQAACPHPLDRGTLQTAEVPSGSKIRKGDRVRWCLDCNSILSVNGVPYSKVAPYPIETPYPIVVGNQ